MKKLTPKVLIFIGLFVFRAGLNDNETVANSNANLTPVSDTSASKPVSVPVQAANSHFLHTLFAEGS